jgi:uncharacterized membrane protein YoaK (UPF0700 family)
MSSHSDKRRGDALVILLLLLSVTTGLVDAVSVLGLGKVFTANMTGNVVFLGFAIAGVPGFSWPLYIVALLFFALGAVFAGRIAARHSGSGRRRWLLRGAMSETALLWLAALIAVVAPPADENGSVYAMIALTAAAMGARNTTIRQLKVPDLTTTVLTLTITGLASESTLAGGGNPNLVRRVLAIVAILVGAVAGALLLTRFGPAPPLFVAGLAVAMSTWLLVIEDIG